jgi:O-antigen/teichoic acid export membrane protein
MDKKKSLLNVIVAISFKFILLILSLISRRFLIRYVGNEATGLFSLYTSIVGFLAVAELGVGSAITFCMYKPIVDNKKDEVAALYHLFTKLYLIIGGIILVAGFAIMPFLPYFAKDYADIDINLYWTFALMLTSTVLSYMFSSKSSVINAYKNNYITTTINSLGNIIRYILQIVIVIFTKSFELYLVATIISVLIEWLLTSLVFNKKYKEIKQIRAKVNEDTKHEVVKKVKAMFMHKIGGLLVNTADSIIISAFIGVVILGKYSNYTTIMTAMTGVITLFFSPLTSVIGHLCVKSDKEEVKKYFNFFYTFNFILGIVFFLGYYSIIDDLIVICFGNDLEMAKSVSMVITINYFIQFMRQATLLFRDATGLFYYDRWKPLFEGISNVVFSIGFVYLFSYLFGDEFAVVGVIVATIITNIFICHIVEPHVLYKYEFESKTYKYYLKNYSCIASFVAALFLLNFLMRSNDNVWIELLINGFISVGISCVFILVFILIDKDFRFYIKKFINKVKNRHKNKSTSVVETTAKSDVELNENESLKSETSDDINESREENKD